jgi:hypothetical protein
MLNLSWDELRSAVGPLRKIIGYNRNRICGLLTFAPPPALPWNLHRGSIFWDIAFGYLPILHAVHASRLPEQFRQVSFNVIDMNS